MTGPKSYATTIAIRSPADADDVTATFLRWTWYAARRAGLHLDGASDDFSSQERVSEALGLIAPSLHLRDDDVAAAAAGMRMERWGAGERLQREGEVPTALRFVMRGRVVLDMRTLRGDLVMTGELPPGQILGLVGLTRQRILVGRGGRGRARGARGAHRSHRAADAWQRALARDMGRAIDIRTQSQVAAKTELLAGREPTPEVLSLDLIGPQ